MCGWQWGVQVRTSTPHLSHLHQPVKCMAASKFTWFACARAQRTPTTWSITIMQARTREDRDDMLQL